jgi:hypothetical protein
MTLEEELSDALCATGLAARQRDAVTRRLGWDGRRPATLKSAGEAAGYTRERVRQLEARAIEILQRRRPKLERVREAVGIVEAAAPAPRNDVAALLAGRGISAQPFDVGGVLSAARVAGIETRIIADDHAVLRGEDAVRRPIVFRVARRLARQHGATTAAEVAGLVGLRAARVLILLEEHVHWLDDEWLTVEPLGGPFVASLRKLLAIDRAAAIESTLPSHVLEALVRMLEPVALSQTEQTLVEIVRAGGATADIRRQAAQRGINPSSAAVCLSRSPLFRRVGRGRWALAL